MQKVAYEILRDMSGDQTESLQQLTIQDLHTMIFGLPSVSQFLEVVRIEDITDRNAFTDEEITFWRDKLSEAYERLEAVLFGEESEFASCFQFRGHRYFWIDADILP